MAPHSGEMVKSVMRDKGMTQVDLAKRIGKDQTLISRYMSGQIEISAEAARAIAEVLDIDFEELRHQLQRDKYERRQESLGVEFKDVIRTSDKIEPKEIHHVGSVVIETIAAVPLLDSIPSGVHDHRGENVEKYILPPGVHMDTEKSFALKVSGDSMTDDEVDEGDIIVVDAGTQVQDGDRALVILRGVPVLRKIYRKGKTVVLQSSEDREEPVIFLSGEDDFEIVGRVALCTKLF